MFYLFIKNCKLQFANLNVKHNAIAAGTRFADNKILHNHHAQR